MSSAGIHELRSTNKALCFNNFIIHLTPLWRSTLKITTRTMTSQYWQVAFLTKTVLTTNQKQKLHSEKTTVLGNLTVVPTTSLWHTSLSHAHLSFSIKYHVALPPPPPHRTILVSTCCRQLCTNNVSLAMYVAKNKEKTWKPGFPKQCMLHHDANRGTESAE